MRPRRALLPAVTLWLLAGTAAAHHAFAPVYDGSRTIVIEGVVLEFRLINPHAMMTLETTDDAGHRLTWTVEFAGRLHLSIAGWNEDTLDPGERVTVHGNPTHVESQRMYFTRIVKADGTELASARQQGLATIEEQRRQRAQQRAE